VIALASAAGARAATLEVTVTGIRNAAGDIRVAICSRARFLQETCEHVAHAPAAVGSVTLRVPDVPPGVWAAQAFHDENRDGKIDTVLGIPTEGLGFSNDAAFRFGPPDFNEAAFRLGPGGGVIRFSLRYKF
jgi:uncharacterized protein (DUF2141 family)